ncbi:glycosyltransferase family 4 protein [Lutibaculum baratangense]|uniref:Glycosyltransferase n=1 Tax=Lutibaculum baratangense AMV1 TaxID=631454 RepID=V4RKT0_9HYPH|nr:glycosyltransferase family 4 protein [Lutibaculum baratangense]ESR25889.1 Glycosyltransferase [Lutibaculum baratangense AMV1]
MTRAPSENPPVLAGRTVLQIVPDLEAGGAERTTVDIAAALVKAGARALVATTGGRLVPELEAAGGTHIAFPAATKNPARILANAGALSRLIRREGVDLVHARSRAPAWSGLIAARRTGVPFVTTYHGAYRSVGRLKNFYNGVMARGDVVIANSGFTQALILKRHPQAEGRTRVVYRGTDLSRFDPAAVAPERVAAMRRAWGVAADRKVVLLPARLTSWKGQEVLIDAAGNLAAAGRMDFDVVLAGDEQGRTGYRDRLVDRMLKAGLGHRVRIVGHVEDVPAALAAADVVTTPSTEPEAFGRSAAEAQAMGKPVVVSDIGAVRETVLAPPEATEEARTGWRVPPSNALGLAQALNQALDLEPEAARAMGARGRAHVLSLFSLERMVAETLGIYRELLGPRP